MQATCRTRSSIRMYFERSASCDPPISIRVSLAHSWLQGYDADEQARAGQGFVAPPPPPVELVRGMSGS